jgi:hypothetical protein
VENKRPTSEEQVQKALIEGVGRDDAVALQVSSRAHRIAIAKAKSFKRLLERVEPRMNHVHQRLQARVATYEVQAESSKHQLLLADKRPHPLALVEGRTGAYGRVVDEHGQPWVNLALALSTATGEVIRQCQSDENGYFSLWTQEPPKGDLLLAAKGLDKPIPLTMGRKSSLNPAVRVVVPRGGIGCDPESKPRKSPQKKVPPKTPASKNPKQPSVNRVKKLGK